MTIQRHPHAELAAFREAFAGLGLTYDQLTACLGGACYDVYLSDVAYWRCVPARVWTYTIGGYQVMKKWLSYRERALLGRDLKADEARYVTSRSVASSSTSSEQTKRPWSISSSMRSHRDGKLSWPADSSAPDRR